MGVFVILAGVVLSSPNNRDSLLIMARSCGVVAGGHLGCHDLPGHIFDSNHLHLTLLLRWWVPPPWFAFPRVTPS